MSKVKEREKEQPIKGVVAKKQGSFVKKQASKEAVDSSSKTGTYALVAIAEYRPAPIQHGDHFVGLRFDQQGFEAEKRETIRQVDRYSRFIDHVLELQKDEADLADWSIARAVSRRKK